MIMNRANRENKATACSDSSETLASSNNGICMHQTKDTPIRLRNFLNSIEVPVILFDSDTQVKMANVHACRLLGKDCSQVEGLVGGDVFECPYARLPEGCGNTIHCSGCAIRRSVMETYSTGKGLHRIPATMKQQNAGEIQDISLIISTEKLDQYVMLFIKDTKNAEIL